MSQQQSVIKKQYLLVILLFTFVYVLLQFVVDQPINLSVVPTSLVTIVDEKEKVPKSSWLEYSKNWDGKILVIYHPSETKVTLTNNYRVKMRSKGLHPLNIQYKRLRDRMERVEEYCNTTSISGSDADFKIIGSYSVIFHDQSQLLQCLVQKAGSSSWAHVFSEMTGVKIRRPYNPEDAFWRTVALISNMKDNRLTARRFQTYTKFMFSRQPFQRLLSAYKDKFQGQQSWYEETFAPQIISANYLSNYSKAYISQTRKKLKNGIISSSSSEVVRQIARLDAGFQKYDITLLEFLKYLIFFTRRSGAFNLDGHWKPISLLCNPCAIKYDVIGMFETLSEDSQAIIDFVHPNIPDFQYNFPKRDPEANSTCDGAFRKIPLDVRRSLYDIYKDDFLLFGYEYNEDESVNIC